MSIPGINAKPELIRITLAELRAVIQLEPPAGADLARGCGYNAQRLAGQCGRSLRWLEQVFRDLNQSPHNWLHERRLLHGLGLLHSSYATGELVSIKRVALDCGYRHPGNFFRAFKKAFGISPRVYLIEREKILRTMGINLNDLQAGRL